MEQYFCKFGHPKARMAMKKIFLLLAILLISLGPLAVSSCVNTPAEIDFSVESDYSRLVAAIENVNKSLSDRMSLLEAAMESGLANDQAALALIRKAVESVGGNLENKLAAVSEAVKSQGTSLDTKLVLIEAAVDAGFADGKAQQTLLEEAIASLGGSLEEKLSAVETAMKSKVTGLDTKLGLIEAAVETGLADSVAAQEMLKEAIDSLGGTLEAKMAAIDSTLASQSTTLASKLALVETAVKEGFAGEKTLQELILQTLETLGGSVEARMAAIEKAMEGQTTGLETKLEVIEAALTQGFADGKAALDLMVTAVSSLKGTVSGVDRDVDAVVATLGTLDPAIGTVAAVLTTLLADASHFPDYKTALAAIQNDLFILTSDNINGYLYVDMGSGLRWATMNVGATSPEEYGDYFAWAETTTKTEYTIDTYKYIQKESISGGYEYKITKYMKDTQDQILGVEDDAARQNWGATWRTPTKEELAWLQNHCSWEWVEYNGVKGLMATSKVQGYESKQLFFPAAGYYNDENPVGLVDTGVQGFYMSSGVVSLESYLQITYLQIQEIQDGAPALNSFKRWCGFSVRPVSD